MKILNYSKIIYSVFVISFVMSLSACKKYLDEKPNKNLQIPQTIEDAQKLLDNYEVSAFSSVVLGDASSDNHFIPDEIYNNINLLIRNLYLWKTDIYVNELNAGNDWQVAYKNIYYTNLSLEALKDVAVNDNNRTQFNNVKGTALYLRASIYWELATAYAKAYSFSTSSTDLGLPLRLNTNFNEKSIRATNQATYSQIIQDLQQSVDLLPNTSEQSFYRPTKPAAYGLLSKVYLSMGDYKNAGKYANLSLSLKDELVNYNDIDTSSTAPFADHLQEVITFALQSTIAFDGYQSARIDTTFYKSFAKNDLRRIIYFEKQSDGYYMYKGGYVPYGMPFTFAGIATDEEFLIRAECRARDGDITGAMEDLNRLAKKRYSASNFVPFSASSKDEAVSIILIERRKELCFRNTRWSDIKRLNLEGANIKITRTVDKQTYTLPANDNRFALPIPQLVIDQSGIQQNPR